MSSEIPIAELTDFAVSAVSAVVLFYAAYLSFNVRNGLAVPLYKSRALWLGTLSILFGVTFVGFNRIDVLFPSYEELARFLFYDVVVLLTFAALAVWVDRTAGTLIRLDYLRKDIVCWKRARPLYWLAVALGLAFYVIGTGYYVFGIVDSITTFSTNGVTIVPILVALTYAFAVLVVGSIRTRDLTFRKHAMWFAIAVVGFVLFIVAPSTQIVDVLPEILFAYSFYRMARSLVPINKL